MAAVILRTTPTMSTGGLSEARLGRMHDVTAGYVERGEVPGLVMLVCRHNHVAAAPGRFGSDGSGASWSSDAQENTVASLMAQRLDSSEPSAIHPYFRPSALSSDRRLRRLMVDGPHPSGGSAFRARSSAAKKSFDLSISPPLIRHASRARFQPVESARKLGSQPETTRRHHARPTLPVL